jgi:hypothetical protein
MSSSILHLAGVLAVITALAGCSTTPSGNPAGPTDSSSPSSAGVSKSNQQDYASATREYRHHAAELREMARRRQIEADVLAQKENPDMEKVQAKRELAKDLLEAADQSEAKARELQRKVPHGMVQ